MRGLLDELEKVMYLQCEGQILSYDTTFQLGDFYFSTLIFRHSQKLCIPALFLIHERKRKQTHVEFFQTLEALLPSIKKSSITPLVTDREPAIVAAVSQILPDLTLVHCWNHIYHSS